jgi:uridine kinase
VAVENRIVKIQKRNRALTKFEPERIHRAILRAASSLGGFQADYLPGINERIFDRGSKDDQIAEFLTEVVVVCLNSNPQHLISNFPPTIEGIQDTALHTLRSYGFQNTADAYECYRWGRHWLREGAIAPEEFVGNGVPSPQREATLAWNCARGCDTISGLNEIVRAGKLKTLVDESLSIYEQSLDATARAIITHFESGNPLRLIWIVGPSSSGKTTSTVKLTERLSRHGLGFQMLNLDDYFWSLVEHPTDWINDRNYETPEALDIQLLNRHLRELLEGKTIHKPVFNFKEGRQTATKPVQLEKEQVLLLDCLHGFYPPITEGIDPSAQFRLYIESENSVYLQRDRRSIPAHSTDVRLLRRMLRDAHHRNHSPLLTLLHWHYVRAGEFFSIIPLRGLADRTINAAFPFELPALKPFLCGPEGRWPQRNTLESYPGFLDARIRYQRVQELLEAVQGLSVNEVTRYELIPGDAPIREFIGGSTIRIPHNE